MGYSGRSSAARALGAGRGLGLGRGIAHRPERGVSRHHLLLRLPARARDGDEQHAEPDAHGSVLRAGLGRGGGREPRSSGCSGRGVDGRAGEGMGGRRKTDVGSVRERGEKYAGRSVAGEGGGEGRRCGRAPAASCRPGRSSAPAMLSLCLALFAAVVSASRSSCVASRSCRLRVSPLWSEMWYVVTTCACQLLAPPVRGLPSTGSNERTSSKGITRQGTRSAPEKSWRVVAVSANTSSSAGTSTYLAKGRGKRARSQRGLLAGRRRECAMSMCGVERMRRKGGPHSLAQSRSCVARSFRRPVSSPSSRSSHLPVRGQGGE